MAKIDLHYTIDLLNSEYWCGVYVGSDEKKLQKLLYKHFEVREFEINWEYSMGKCYMKSGYAPFIAVNAKNCAKKGGIYPTLAHEAVHAVNFTFETIGATYNDEIFAHSVGAIIRKFNKLK